MNHRIRNSVFALGMVAILAACTNNPPPQPPVIVPTTTKVLSTTTQAALENVQPNTLTFAGTPAIMAGDVVVSSPTSAAPDGFLRKVTSVRQENGKTILETAPATLCDAIQKGSLQATRALNASDVESTNLTQGVKYLAKRDARADNPTFSFDKVLYDRDGDDTTKDDQVALRGSLDLKTTVNFDWDIDFLPPDFDFLAKANFIETSNLTLAGKESFKFDKKIRVGQIRFKPITFSIGPVPVVIRPIIQLDVGIRGSVNGEVSVSVTQTLVMTAGAKYNEEWMNLSDVSNDFNVDSSIIKGSLNAEIYANTTLELLLYESVGLYVRPEVFVALDAQFPRKPYWKLDGGIGVDLGVEIDKWGIEKSYKTRVFENRFPIAQSSNTAPTVNFEPNPSADLNRIVSLRASAGDFEDGANLTYAWNSSLSEDGELGTGAEINKAFGTVGTRTITVTVKDSDGATATKSANIEITNAAPNVSISEPNSTAVIYKDLTYSFQANASDPNEPDDQLACASIVWTSSVATDAFPKTGCEISAAFSSLGARTLTVTASDPQGLTHTRTVNVNVLPTPANPPPNPVTITSPKAGDGSPSDANGLWTLTGTATDPAGAPVTLEWFAAMQGISNGIPIEDFGANIKLNLDAQNKVDVIAALGLECANQGYSVNIRIALIASDPQNNKNSNSVIRRNIVCVP
jgi:PKD domain